MLVCVECRKVDVPCNHEKISVDGNRWRAPKMNNNKAWKLIESGDIWWDKRYMNQVADMYRWAFGKTLGRKNKEIRKAHRRSPSERRIAVAHGLALAENRRRKYDQSISS